MTRPLISRSLLAVGCILATTLLVNAQTAGDTSHLESVQLRVENFKELGLLIEKVDHRNSHATITEEALQTRAELRMRAAGIKPSVPRFRHECLHVSFITTGDAFVIRLALAREVSWALPWTPPDGKNIVATAEVWTRSSIGTGAQTDHIIEVLDSLMDHFLSGYLRANQ